jgi:raffinose/stachyose/melibiose transport system permease protein
MAKNKAESAKPIIVIGLMNIPATVIYSVLFAWPMIQVIYLSFFKWNGMARVPKEFIGLGNYIQLFQDKDFFRSLSNSMAFILTSLVIILPVSLMLALLINTNLRGKGFFKSVYYIPTILPIAVTGLLWIFMLTSPPGAFYNSGVVNTILGFLIGHKVDIKFLSNAKIAIWTVTLVNAWRLIGQYMLFFLTGLTSIPGDIIEASIVDGARPWQKLVYIIIPNLKETFKIFLILNLSGAFQVFDIVYVLTQGGPANATQVPVTLLFNNAFRFFGSFGYGATIGVVILVISMFIAFLTNRHLSQEG